ncbi:hypothetical protein FE783_32220 [Paenibacillus mesophilus]|nr:hypothetical protein FE783_32220 [Paenibacillus mesophilus]
MERGMNMTDNRNERDDTHFESKKDSEGGLAVSRRRLLTAIGLGGTALASAGLLRGTEALAGHTVNHFVYGGGPGNGLGGSCHDTVKKYGAAGDGTTDDQPAWSAAIAALANGGDLCVPPGVYRIGSNLLIPSHITLIFANGAKLAPDTGAAVTIEGGVRAAPTHIFSGAGVILGLSRTEAVYPEWWGAAGNGSTDDTAAFRLALAAAGRLTILEGRQFLIGNVDLIGKRVSGSGTIVKLSTAECAFHAKGDGTVIEGLKFQGRPVSGQPHVDIKLGDGARNIRIHGCTFRSPIYSAVAGAIDSSLPGGGDYAQQTEGVILSGNLFQGYVRPLYLYSVSNITITGNLIRDSLYDGIRLRENDGFCLIDGNQFINIGDPSWPDNQTRDAIDTYWSGKDLTITNNIVDTTAYIGFDLKGVAPNGSYNSSRVIVANNQIYRTRYDGIKISFGSEDPLAPHAAFYNVTGNIVHECNQNNKDGNGSVGNAGILLLKVKHANVTDNFVFSNYGRGIFVNNPKSLADSGGDVEHKNKFIRISGNMCVNNGQAKSVSNSSGILSLGTGYLIVSENICENDPGYPNYNMQGVGLNISSAGTGFTNYKNAIVRDNICRNNVNYQIILTGADGLTVFEGNVQEGTNAAYRPWHHQRTRYSGSAIPAASDGAFRSGDIIYNIAATRTRNISHWQCVGDGAPGTWRAFGCGWGTTAERPALAASDAGYQYMDTNLNKTILWDGTAWLGI